MSDAHTCWNPLLCPACQEKGHSFSYETNVKARDAYHAEYLKARARIQSLESACEVAKEALDRIAPYLPTLAAGAVHFSAHAQAAELCRVALAALREHSSREPSPNGERVALLEALAAGVREMRYAETDSDSRKAWSQVVEAIDNLDAQEEAKP